MKERAKALAHSWSQWERRTKSQEGLLLFSYTLCCNVPASCSRLANRRSREALPPRQCREDALEWNLQLYHFLDFAHTEELFMFFNKFSFTRMRFLFSAFWVPTRMHFSSSSQWAYYAFQNVLITIQSPNYIVPQKCCGDLHLLTNALKQALSYHISEYKRNMGGTAGEAQSGGRNDDDR